MDRMNDRYIGRLLDNRYEIQELVGIGGMAYVYKALCHRLNRIVAVKILKDEFVSDEDFRRRFHAESQAVAQLSHPNIVSAYDVSKSDECEYIVMEYIDGMTLKQYMQRKGPLPWREALHYVIQIVKALNHAHSRGVIHRDIKPQNIMLLRDGSIKVADFGIARFASTQNTLTKEALGSVHYISPEQARGSQIDVRSDIYSTGVVMYEMLTGRLPYEGDSPVSVAIQHINSMPLTPRDINPDIPEALEAITMKAMAPNINNRFVDTEDMLYDLEEFRKNPNIVFHYHQEPAAVAARPAEPTQAMAPVHFVPSPEAVDAANGVGAPAAPLMAELNNEEPSIRDMMVKRKTATAAGGKKKKKRHNYTFTLGALAVLILVGGLAALFFVIMNGMGGGEDNNEATVPMLVGELATTVLSDTKYEFEISAENPVYSNEYDTGFIVDQNPKADTKAIKGSTITIVVCLGPLPLTLPDYKGETEVDVLEKLRALQLEVETVEEYFDDVEPGLVGGTMPAAGAKLKDLKSITVKISKGGAPVTVPDLKNKSKANAKTALEEVGLVLGAVTFDAGDGEVRNGNVLRQSIAADQQAPKGTAVDIVVVDTSLDESTVIVPNLLGMDINDVKNNSEITDNFKIEIKETREYSDTIDNNGVIKQSPKANNKADKGSTITVTLSKGAKPGPMPNVKGKSINDATDALEALGLTVSSSKREEYSTSVEVGKVIGTDPAAGDPQPEDGLVKLIVSLGPEATATPPPTQAPTPSPVATTPPPTAYENIKVMLPTDVTGSVRCRVYQNVTLIYDKTHDVADGSFKFSTNGYANDVIKVMFGEVVAYTTTLGALGS